MAIIDTSVTGSFVEDRDPNQYVGIQLPFYKSDGPEGYFASTSTTIEAVKNNIKNLLQTEKGERYLQPDLGVTLRRHNEKDCIKVMEDWWKEIRYGSKRDQLSFNYVAWKNKFKFNYMNSDCRDNSYFYLDKHTGKK